MHNIIESLLAAPDGQLDPAAKAQILQWADPPLAVEIYKLIDHCVYYAWASEFTMKILHILLDLAKEKEDLSQKTLDSIANSTWRVNM